jgi:hypothetical protein
MYIYAKRQNLSGLCKASWFAIAKYPFVIIIEIGLTGETKQGVPYEF